MYRPQSDHGTDQDIAGEGIANPIGTIWAGAMMMQHLGYPRLHDTLMEAIETVLREAGNLTRDMGGNASTRKLGQAVVAATTR
ncbi:MAG: isocitrate/isopropylmalate family dehydrogenase [Desulfobacteraceae bacterium]|nr:isocitrate/isopropylmalate family dehydrogenase [Desulfobacteraceae bacterium]